MGGSFLAEDQKEAFSWGTEHLWGSLPGETQGMLMKGGSCHTGENTCDLSLSNSANPPASPYMHKVYSAGKGVGLAETWEES